MSVHSDTVAVPLGLPLGLDDGLGAQLLQLWIPGVPVPQGSKVPMPIYAGSKRGGTRRFTGKVAMVEQRSATLDAWRGDVERTAREHWAPRAPIDGPLVAGFAFWLTPWKSTKDGEWPIGSRTGDMAKLVRGVEDALTTAGVWVDDRKVVGYLGYPLTSKRFARPGEPTGCQVLIHRAPPLAPGR